MILRYEKSHSDYTVFDGYDEACRSTQCGGINYCIKTLLEKNPFNAPIYYKEDLLHMNEDGYRKIGPVQAAFIANGF